MKSPELDLEDRKIVWDDLQMIYMDTDVNHEIKRIAPRLAKSKYSLNELEQILFLEVLPACKYNLFTPVAPEWCGYEIDWLTEQILKRNKFISKKKPIVMRWYTKRNWSKLAKLIEKERKMPANKSL